MHAASRGPRCRRHFVRLAGISYRDGELRPRDWLTSLRGVEEAAWFSWDDPVPFGAMWIYSAKYALNRMVLNGRRRRSGERRTTRPGIGG